MNIVMHPFKGSPNGVVEGKVQKSGENDSLKSFAFESERENESIVSVRWVANLKLPFAHKISSGLAERLHTPGVDDYEPLR